MRRRCCRGVLLNLLAVVSLLIAVAILSLWLCSRPAPVVVRLPGCELLAAYNEFYVWTGSHSLLFRLHFVPLLLIFLAAPVFRVTLIIDGYVRRKRPTSATVSNGSNP